jgi:iron-sulfur cluster insertion protein
MDEIYLTSNASARIHFLRKKQQNDNLYLRVVVEGGGCSGFKYILKMDDSPLIDEFVFEKDGAQLIIDGVSLNLLKGSFIDFVEDLSSAQFVIKNPNAATKCGCGNSFSL